MIGAVELEPGTLVDGWQIIRAVKTGGFGAVHHAEQHGKPFAIKVAVHREQSGDTGRTHARALREVAILLTLDHPHIIKPRGFGYLPDGRVYCVLEYVDGWTLGEWLERTHPTFREIARVFAKIAGAVAYMHGRGVLHRDLKLSNVMIRKNGEPVIIDLGCATYANAEELTTTPLPPGTERYRAPEAQEFFYKQGRKRGARYAFKVTDELYAVGVMLHELLTDPLPTKDKARNALADAALDLPPPREVNPRVPQALSALVEGLLARAPALRPESFEALRRELAELADHPGPEYAAQAHPPSVQRAPGEGGQAAGVATRRGWRRVLALADRHASRVRGRLQPRALAGMVAASRQHWRKPLALAGMVAAVVLAAGAAAWLTRERPAPALPSMPREATAPTVPPAGPLPAMKSAPVPAPPQDSAPAVSATAPKEGSPVKPTPPDDLKSPHAARAPKAAPAPTDPGFPAWCKALPIAVAMATNGCASIRMKAEPFECSPGAVESMERLGWDPDREHFTFKLDERCPDRGGCEFTLGGPITGVVEEGTRQPKAPPGTLFYGRIYVTDEENGAPVEIRAIYDHVELPGKAKVPVCVVSGPHGVTKGAKDGTAIASSSSNGRTVRSWAP
ncbi:MAG: serine/threonine protein kinase [Hyalangium sp.]|uniref:serine/threonine protein kinase n=1 Tax=Hyalangium sp. TaxID=2028555 RepID=UPI00389AD5C4